MIYEIKRGDVVIFQHEIRGSRTQSAPAVDFVDIEFDYYEAILLERNDTIEFKGQTYYCDSQFNNIFKKSSNNYQHRARFLSEKYRATEIAVLDPNGVSEFEIEGNLLTLLTLAVDNLNRLSSGWTYTTPPTTVTKLFQISEENVMSFLTKMSGEFEIPFEINDKVITFAYPTHTDAGAFEYGKGKGFLDLKKSYRSGEKIPNTIYATGGDGLTLDSPIIDQSSIDINGVIEGFYSNDDIKPTTRAMMTGVVTVNNVVATTEINYDLNAYKINGQTPIINFETGALAGLSFYIDKFEFDIPTNVSLIYIKHRTVDGALMPNNTVRPLAGDFFNITGITQPPQIILEAKNKLYSEASTFLYNGILRNLVLEANLDPLYAEDLKLNNEIFVNDVNLDINGFFIINEIREYLQDLQRKEIKVDYIGRNFLYTINGERVKLKVKNDNIIELGIQNNYDDLVSAQDELIAIGDELTYIGDEVAVIEAELPSKESKDNKVDTLTPEITTPELYPTVIAVNEGLDNTLTQANNYTNNAVNNAVGGSGVVNSVTGVNVDNSDPKNPIVAEFRPIAQYNSDISNIQSQLNTKLESADLDGFIYDVTYNSTTHTITFYQQNEPNIVIDLPIESLIKGVQLIGDDLVFTFEDGSTVTVPLNTLLVGVVKSVNGLTPNSQGEIVLQITDIPGLSSELANKLDIRMAGLVSNLTQPEKDAILTKLGVVNNIVQVLGLSGNTITLSNGGGSISLNIANIGGLQNSLDLKADASQIPTNYITTNTTQTGLSGDKTTNGIWTFGNGIRVNQTISYGSDIRVRFSASNTVISANTTSPTNGIYLRPQGDTAGSGFGQVFIDGNGQINTDNHGNSSQWYEAYDAIATIPNAANNGLLTITTSADLTGGGTFSADQATASNISIGLSSGTLSDIQLGVTAHSWGDFRDYGLGDGVMNNPVITSDLFSLTGTRFVRYDNTALNTPDNSNGSMMTIMRNSSYVSRLTFSDSGKIFFTYGNSNTWIELYHTGNFNPANYALVSQIPTVNDGQLTLTTGTGLSGSANFTANQSGNSTFDVEIASTHKLPTIAEWNALPTTNTTYTGSNGIDLVGTDFRLSSSTLASLALANTAVQPSALSGYLPLAGGTMTGSIDWTTINTGLSYNGVNRLRFSNNATVLSALGTGVSNSIFLRPQGESTSNGQVTIQADGQINTENHGNSSQWYEAYQGFLTLGSYVLQSSLNTQLSNYATLAGTQTFTGTNTFTQAPIVPNGTLAGHTVNLGQLNTILGDYALASEIPTNNNQLTNGAGYITASALNGYATQLWVGQQGYLTTETDPIFTASPAYGISSVDITNWNSKTSNTGTVTSIAAGTGLSGGTITTSGTIALDASTLASLALANTALQSGDDISELNNDAGYITSSSLPTNYITTNTTQAGLSGDKTTSGIWSFSGTNATSLRLERISGINTNIEYINSGISIFAGSTNGNAFAIGEIADLNSLPNRWMWVDNTGLVSSKAGFSKTGATNADMLLGAGGHRPVSDFALASSVPAQVNLIQGSGIGISGTYPNLTITNTDPNIVQSLTVSAASVGTLSLSGAGAVNLNSLRNIAKVDANVNPFTSNQGGFYSFNAAGTTSGYPASLGGGILFNRNNNDVRASFEFFKAQLTGVNELWFKVGNNTTDYFDYEIVASREWADAKFATIGSIPTVGNGQLSFTAPTGLDITGTFNANQSGNTTIDVDWATGYQGFTTAESNKLAGIQAGATVPNDGEFTVQGTGSLTGSGSTSANASANTTANLDLTTAEKNRIQQGVDAYAVIPSLVDGVDYHHLNTGGHVPIERKKTIVNIPAGSLGYTINIDDALYDGYELAINGCGEWSVTVNGSIMDKCGDTDSITLGWDQGSSALFWWSADLGMWIQAI